MQTRLKRGLIAVAAVAALGAGGVAVAGTTGEDDDDATDRPISGPALERAKAAALAHTGGGQVTDTEAGDEEGAYEVEVTRPGGGQVDVHLDRDFQVLGTEDEEAGDDD